MKSLSNLKIRTQLILLMAVVFVLFAIAAAVSFQALGRAKAEFTRFIGHDQKVLLNFTELYANGLQMGQALRNIILDPENSKAYENFDKAAKIMDELLVETRDLAQADAAIAAPLDEAIKLRQQQKGQQEAIISQVRGGEIDAAKGRLNDEETPTWRALKQILQDQIKSQKAAIDIREQEVQSATSRAQTLSLALTLAAIVIGLAIGMAIVRSILSRVSLLNVSIENLAKGEGDLTARLPVLGDNELSRVAAAFNRFVEGLQGMVNSIKGNAARLHELSANLSQASSSLRLSSGDQTAAVTSTAAAVDEMTASIASVADGAEQVKQVSQESAAYSSQGLERMSHLTSSMSSVQQAVKGMAGSVGQFLESTQSIIGATQHVKDIADQINLLALNAAIEAARAGEQGRGFAVVADEVRKLAEKTAQYANEISQVTAELEQRSTQVEGAIRQGESALEAGSRSSGEAAEIVRQAHDAVQGATRGVQEISVSVREQSYASSQISSNIERIADLAAKNQHAIEQSCAIVKETHQLADTLHATVSTFRS